MAPDLKKIPAKNYMAPDPANFLKSSLKKNGKEDFMAPDLKKIRAKNYIAPDPTNFLISSLKNNRKEDYGSRSQKESG